VKLLFREPLVYFLEVLEDLSALLRHEETRVFFVQLASTLRENAVWRMNVRHQKYLGRVETQIAQSLFHVIGT